MQKQITGRCPTLNREYTITVRYIDASDKDGKEYIKGISSCEHIKHGGTCDYRATCPLYEVAPQSIK